jgi:hypothetical protein
MKNEYQPKTGERCGCRRGIERDNCAACEGTGQRIDFKAIRARKLEPAAAPEPVDALELLRRGLECGVFDDAPFYKEDVKKLLEGK